MAYVTVPKDLTKIKSKVMFNLTKRQLLCFGAAVAIGLPLFFLTKDSAGTTTAALCMVLAMLPMFLLAMYEKNGQPLEVIKMCIRDRLYKYGKTYNPASATDTYLSWFPSVSFFPEVTAIEIKYVSDGGLIIENPKFHVVEKSKNI